jgi:hypothetical protein
VLGNEAQVVAARDRVSAGEPGHRIGIDPTGAAVEPGIDRHDVRVFERRSCLDLGEEPPALLLARQLTGPDHLERDHLSDRPVPRAVG